MSKKNKFSQSANLIADLLQAQFPTIGRSYTRDSICNSCESFIQEWRIAMLNAAPSVPADDPPAETKYPDRGNPAPVSVPDPADTEGTESTKESTPDYLRFTNALVAVSQSGKSLFEIESGDGPESDDKRSARYRALDDVDELKSSIYGL